MAALNDLISQIQDADLRARIEEEINKLAKRKKFGLVWEDHISEATLLYDVPVKRNKFVVIRGGDIDKLFLVQSIEGNIATCLSKSTMETVTIPVSDLVCVAQFGEPIYPYLQPVDSLCNAPDSDLWHVLIQADNYHALQLLEYMYTGMVDCIYIDPPYNTGARDWKYNNDYVDSTDSYRHSKWLSMMEKRLKLAKKLLNPKESVLIVTIDEKEYLHLGCLLEEMFPEARIQMVSSVISQHGAARLNSFTRTNEYLYFVMLGSAGPREMMSDNEPMHEEVSWRTLRRWDIASKRGSTKGGTAQFYPIYINNTTGRVQCVGAPLSPNESRFNVPQIDDCTAVFPVRPDGTEMNWGLVGDVFMERVKKGYVRIGKHTPDQPQQYQISYLQAGIIADIDSGKVKIIGYDKDGAARCEYQVKKGYRATTQWNIKSHNAETGGSLLIRSIIGNRFSFPKSLYAVHDCLNLITEKKNALIVDFFAGSGTTLHAVNLLNAEDGGLRRCIMITNNEVSNEEAKALTSQGFKPGDPEWERFGIARYVTWPRTVCSIKGCDIKGQPLKGNYLGSDLPMAEGFKANVAFFELGFLDKTALSLGRQLKELVPVLWMKAGAHGSCPTIEGIIPPYLIWPENRMAILTSEVSYAEFSEQISRTNSIETVYIVTGSEAGYREMSSGLNIPNTYQLYRDYLDNFRINTGR